MSMSILYMIKNNHHHHQTNKLEVQDFCMVATYIFLLEELEDLHKGVNHPVQFQAPANNLLEEGQIGHLWALNRLVLPLEQDLELELEFLVEVHHVHLAKQLFQGEHRLSPVLLKDSRAFLLLKLLLLLLVHV